MDATIVVARHEANQACASAHATALHLAALLRRAPGDAGFSARAIRELESGINDMVIRAQKLLGDPADAPPIDATAPPPLAREPWISQADRTALEFAHDPLGTICRLVGQMPCPPGTALVLLAGSGDGPMEIRRGSAADIEALWESVLPEHEALADREVVGHG